MKFIYEKLKLISIGLVKKPHKLLLNKIIINILLKTYEYFLGNETFE